MLVEINDIQHTTRQLHVRNMAPGREVIETPAAVTCYEPTVEGFCVCPVQCQVPREAMEYRLLAPLSKHV